MIKKCIAKSFITLILMSIIVTANAQSIPEECLVKGEINVQLLPSNMRIVVDDLDELSLLDPFNNMSTTAIPNSSTISTFAGNPYSGMPILYQQDRRMLVVGADTWLSMDIDGQNATIVTTIPDWFEIQLNEDGLSLYRDLETDLYQVLDVTTGETINYAYPELVNYVRLRTSNAPYDERPPEESIINPNLDYVAYRANDGESLNDEIFRVQHVPTGEYFDISSEMIDGSDVTATYLSWKSDYIIGLHSPNDDAEYIFDVIKQESIQKIQPPNSEWSLHLPTSLSTDNSVFATLFKLNTENKIYILELRSIMNELIECLQIEQAPTSILSNNCYQCGDDFNWTFDSNLLWWLECNSKQVGGRCEDTYRLMIFDMEANQYGVLLNSVGVDTRIGFIDS